MYNPMEDTWIATYGTMSLDVLGKYPCNHIDLEKILVQDSSKKGDRYAIYFQDFLEDISVDIEANNAKLNRLLDNIQGSTWMMVDMDMKSEKSQKDFLKDYKNGEFTDIKLAVRDLYNELIDVDYVYFAGITNSKLGIRIICKVLHNSDNFNVDDDFKKFRHKKKVEYVLTLLNNKFGIKYKKNSYVDDASFRLNQGTYSCSEGKFRRKSLRFLNLELDIRGELDKFYNHVNFTNSLIESGDVNNTTDDEIINNISDFGHYNYKYLNYIKALDLKNRKVAYDYLKESYEGDSLRPFLLNFDKFNKYIDKIKGENIIKVADKTPTSDLFKNKYNKNLNFDKYLTSISHDLDLLNNTNDNLILKAPTGAGKTTYFVDWMLNNTKKGESVVFTAPTNIILEQTYQKILSKAGKKDINIIKNYGEKKDKLIADKTKINIVLSSFKSLKKLRVMNTKRIIVDEAHNLVINAEYNDDFTMLDNRCTTYISATPEPLATCLNLEDNKYINFVDKNYQKKELDLFLINKGDLCEYLIKYMINTGNTQLIYINNKHKIEYVKNKVLEIYTGLTMNDIGIIDADHKNEKTYVDLVMQNTLNKKIVFTTKIINEGTNVENIAWDDLLIIDEGRNLNIFELYQLSNRFRNVDVNIRFLMHKMPACRIFRDDLNIRKEFENINNSINSIKKMNKFEICKELIDVYFKLIRSNYKVFSSILNVYFNVNVSFALYEMNVDKGNTNRRHDKKKIKEFVIKYYKHFENLRFESEISSEDKALYMEYSSKIFKYYSKYKKLIENMLEYYLADNRDKLYDVKIDMLVDNVSFDKTKAKTIKDDVYVNAKDIFLGSDLNLNRNIIKYVILNASKNRRFSEKSNSNAKVLVEIIRYTFIDNKSHTKEELKVIYDEPTTELLTCLIYLEIESFTEYVEYIKNFTDFNREKYEIKLDVVNTNDEIIKYIKAKGQVNIDDLKDKFNFFNDMDIININKKLKGLGIIGKRIRNDDKRIWVYSFK